MFNRDELSDHERDTHHTLAAGLFNHVWSLMDTGGRSREQDDEMLNAAHASRYHWSLVGNAKNLSIGEWQISRVYAILGRAEPAMFHGQRNLKICQDNNLDAFVLGFAYESLARAAAVAGDAVGRDDYLKHANAAASRIKKKKDRQMLEKDLGQIEEM